MERNTRRGAHVGGSLRSLRELLRRIIRTNWSLIPCQWSLDGFHVDPVQLVISMFVCITTTTWSLLRMWPSVTTGVATCLTVCARLPLCSELSFNTVRVHVSLSVYFVERDSILSVIVLSPVDLRAPISIAIAFLNKLPMVCFCYVFVQKLEII